jgi:hypothetical protein
MGERMARKQGRGPAGTALVLLLGMGCAVAPEVPGGQEDFGFLPSGTAIWARGPWSEIQPSEDVDAVIDQLCPRIMRLPRATLQDYGQEYCGALYTVGDGLYYASHPSPLGRREPPGPQRRKSCYPPREVRDARGKARPVADFHSHPWAPSGMSSRDREALNQLWLIRIGLILPEDKAAGRVTALSDE